MYIFARNKEVNEMNDQILNKMPGEIFEVGAIVHHSKLKHYEPMVKNTGFIVDTSLMKLLRFKINSKFLLTFNINVVDGMCNGSFCKIVGTKRNNQGTVIEIHVQFLNPSHGVETSTAGIKVWVSCCSNQEDGAEAQNSRKDIRQCSTISFETF